MIVLLLNAINICVAYNLFVGPHFGLKPIPLTAFAWAFCLYLIQKNTSVESQEIIQQKPDEYWIKVIRISKQNMLAKVTAMLLVIVLYFIHVNNTYQQ